MAGWPSGEEEAAPDCAAVHREITTARDSDPAGWRVYAPNWA
ncbi:hypothetical protein [Paenibacillus dendritiformis]